MIAYTLVYRVLIYVRTICMCATECVDLLYSQSEKERKCAP